MRVEPFQDQNRLKLSSKRSSKMDPEFIKNRLKINGKSHKNQPKSSVEGSRGRFGWDPRLQDRFLMDLGCQHESKLGPS